jgi:hypothetical protein
VGKRVCDFLLPLSANSGTSPSGWSTGVMRRQDTQMAHW